MAQQTINVGAAPNDGTGTPLRTAFQYTNSNFTELYTALGGGSGLPGASTQVIFNDGGTNLAGSAGLVFNKTTSVLGVGTVNAGAAIVSGDLTVDTSTLKVDSANDRVGVGTASPTSKLHVSNTGAVTRITITDDTTNGRSGYIESNFLDALVIGTTSGVRAIRFSPDNKPYYQIATDGVQTWLDGIGGTRMTLNSTGLGVGVASPTRKLSIVGSGATYANINSGDNTSLVGLLLGGTSTPSAGQVIYDNTANSLSLFTSGSSRLLIDSSGNVISNVTGTAPTLATNSQMVFNLTSNTNLRISVRGTDGVTRTANITLA